MTDLEAIAADLYAGPPGDFVASRNARAKEAEDGEAAERIRALRKPSVAAWVVNVFARERAEQLGQALQLADELREAQADIDAVTLAQLTRQRRALTDRLAADATALATAHGERVTAATRDAVRQTITAAFFDPLAAAAVASGRLVHELEPSAGIPLDLETVLGGGAPSERSASPMPADEVKARRELRKARTVLHEAEQAHARATHELGRADGDARDAAGRVSQLDARITELEADLARTRAVAGTARAEVAAAEHRRTQASDRATATAKAVEVAQRAIDALNAEN